MGDLARRIEELRELAIERGVINQVGCHTKPETYAMALAHALGLDQWLAIDPEISLEDMRLLTDLERHE